MKRIILSFILGTITVLGVNAQSTAKVKVNVVLAPTLSISLGSGAGSQVEDEVTLTYNDVNDYVNGVAKTIANQLKVTSIGSGYRIKASLGNGSGNFTKSAGGGVDSYQANQLIKIGIGANEGAAIANAAATSIAGNMDFGPVGSTSDGSSSVLNKELAVYYKALPLDEGKIKTLLGNTAKEASAIYSVDVLYTIMTN